MRSPAPAKLANEIDIRAYGGSDLAVADLNNDGQHEFVVFQSPGQFKSQLSQSKNRSCVDAVDQDVFCVTVVDAAGRVLWQQGTPYQRDFPYSSHGSGQMIRVADIDGDGCLEVIAPGRYELMVYSGMTGELKAKTPYPPGPAGEPSDNYVQVYTARLGNRRQRQIICKVNDVAYPPWEYANPTVVYSPDLHIQHHPFAVPGAGHNVVPIDVDSDGVDEILIGYSLLDSDMTELWSLPLPEGFNYAGEHADQIFLADIDHDGQPEVLYSGSKDFMAADLQGRLLWRSRAGHSQHCWVGAWGPGQAAQIIMSEKWLGVSGLSAKGEVIWTRSDVCGYVNGDVRWLDETGAAGSWALFGPQMKPVKAPLMSDPAWSRELWPLMMDGQGNLHDVFPWRDEYAHPRQLIRSKRVYDCGITYSHQVSNAALVLDMDGDDRDEVIIHDRQRILVFSLA